MEELNVAADAALRLMADGLDTVPAAAKFLGISQRSFCGLLEASPKK
jgi:hypothetical protein